MEPNVYLPNPLGENQTGFLEFVDYADHHPAYLEHASTETMDDEATTLNHGPHTGHHSQTNHNPPTSYPGAHASAFGPTGTEDEEDDTSMSDGESDPATADPLALASTPHTHIISASLTYHTPYPAAPYSFNSPPPYNAATDGMSDPEGLPWAPTPFHFDPADTEGLIPGTLPPQNPSLLRFLELWASNMGSYPPGKPWYPGITALAKSNLRHIGYDDLRGDWADIQGIDWVDLGVSRDLARGWRSRMYKNFVNISASDVPRVSGPLSTLIFPPPASRTPLTDEYTDN